MAKRQKDLEYWEGKPFNRDPWERQPCDSDQSFRFFRMYADMPFWERSFRKLAQQIVDSDEFPNRNSFLATRDDLAKWSAEHGWVARARLWDDEMDRVRRAEDLRETALAHREVRRGGRKVVRLANQRLDAAKFEEVDGPMEAARLLELGAKLAGLGDGFEWEQADGQQLRTLFAKVVQSAVRWIGESDGKLRCESCGSKDVKDESLPAENRQAQFVAEVNVLVAEALGR